MKIIRLKSENVKRLSAVEITPEGSLVVIGGQNEAGKSSVLDSIQYALGGGNSLPSMPIRQGQKKAHVVLDLGDLKVTRYFTRAGSRLEVSSADGKSPLSSPQAILDCLTGKLSFDPLEFSRMKPAVQTETLKSLVGLDFSALDAERKQVFDERTLVNRDLKSKEAQLAAIPAVEAPDQEIVISDLTSEMEMKIEINQENQKRRDELRRAKESLRPLEQSRQNDHEEIRRLQEKITALHTRISATNEEINGVSDSCESMEKEVDKLEDLPIDEIKQRIKGAEEINRKVRQKKERIERTKELKVIQAKTDQLSKRLEQINSEKEAKLSSASFPIVGLSFGETGITYNGIPFDQCSSAQQLRISLSMGIALNPKLKVILIRDGSLLDETNLKLVAEMAGQNGAQVWLERVGEGKECSVIIEDGHVKEVSE